MRLTVKERILLHLLEYVKHADRPRALPEATREGLAQAAWIDVRHVPQNVRPLIRDGLVVERTMHVQGSSRRRKTYSLTESGTRVAIRLRAITGAQTVPVRGEAGIHEATLSDLVRETGGRWSLIEIARRAVASGTLDLSALASAPAVSDDGARRVRFVEVLQNAPCVDGFVGRGRELAAVVSGDGPRMMVVHGVAGIGKSWFGAKVCELRHGTRNVFWHRVRPWDTPQSILANLGDFLYAVGRPNLRSVVVRGDGALARRVLRDDLLGSNALLVFDDAHHATPEALSLLRDLKDVVAVASDLRVIVLTRHSLPFYDRRDVTLDRTVGEWYLEGLDVEDFSKLLSKSSETVALLNLGRKLGGHPLLIELARAMGHPTTADEYLRDARRFLEEEVYRELSESERRMMKLAALYQTPVPRESLFAGPELTHDVLASLVAKSLIRRAGGEAFEAHDTIRDFFESILTGGERDLLGKFAVGQLRSLARQAEALSERPTSIDYLSNAQQLSQDPDEKIALWESLGDAYQAVGDLLESLTAYKEGLARTQDSETRARLHRKAARPLWLRGENKPAWDEVRAGLDALGNRRSVEQGWLGLLGAFVAPPVGLDGEQPLPPIRAAVDVFRAFGEKRGEAEALLSLGYVIIHAPEGDQAEGERLLQAGLQLAVSLSDPTLVSEAHDDLAHFYTFHGPDAKKALTHVAAAEASARDQGPYARSNAAFWRALAQAELLSDYTGAEANLEEVILLARRIYDFEGGFTARHELAEVAFFRGDLVKARGLYERLWQESKEAGWFRFGLAARCLWTAAECCLLQRDRDGFDRLVAEAEAPGVQAHVSERIVVIDLLLGLSGFLRGEERVFEAHFSRALAAAERAFRTHEAPYQFYSHLVPFFYGIILRARGREDEAAPHIARALDVLQTYKMKARLDVLRRNEESHVEALRAWAPDATRKA